MTEHFEVVIVGGGLAGLTAAHHLITLNPDYSVLLLERARRVGGKILTEHVRDFTIEAGPDSFLSSKPGALDLCRHLGLEHRLQGTNEGRRQSFVLSDGKLQPMPEGLTGLVPSRIEPLLQSELFSPHGKLRLADETKIPVRDGNEDESLASFITRRFGTEAYERLIEPLMGGIYAGDGHQLSLNATFPQLRTMELEHGSVLRAMEVMRGQASGSPQKVPRPAFLAPIGGMSEIISSLHAHLTGVRIVTNREVRQMLPLARGYCIRLDNGDTVQSKAVIVATPAFTASEMLGNIDSHLATLLSLIRYVSTVTVTLAYRAEGVLHPLNGYGFVVPQREGRPLLACTWVSSKFQHRSPKDHVLLRAFVGRSGQQDLVSASEENLLRVVHEELCPILGISAAPVLHRIFRWPRAMPQYNLGHLDLVAAIERDLAAHAGIFLTGNAYRGIGIPDTITSAQHASNCAHAFLLNGSVNSRIN